MQRRRRPWWVWALVCLLGLAAFAAIILAVWKLPSVLYGDVTQASPDARLQAASSFRTAFVAGLAGLAALGSLAMATRTYRLTQEGQITDRYTKAIEQLGSDKLDVRLGGIYALERIAKDSERDHPTVVEVLSTFIREHIDSVSSLAELAAEGSLRGAPYRNPKPTTDVRAALTVLGRLPLRPGISRADLSDAEFAGADLMRMNLSGFSLIGANLQSADLQQVNLQGANLLVASLQGARLREANLQGANLHGADLYRAQPKGAKLQGANLDEAELLGTNLKGAILDGAQLKGARCDADTVWPDGFDWRAAGVLLDEE
jgi:membrane protein implicated in regulation of membrane protease activity